MAVRPGSQTDQALLGVIPELRLSIAGHSIMAAVLHFTHDLHLPRLDIVQLSGEILAGIGIVPTGALFPFGEAATTGVTASLAVAGAQNFGAGTGLSGVAL